MYVLESHTFSASCKTTAAVFTVAPPEKKKRCISIICCHDLSLRIAVCFS